MLGMHNLVWHMYTSNEFPYIKTLELTSWSKSYFSSDVVSISLYIKRRNKGGALICKYPN